MSALDAIVAALVIAGCFFYFAGTVGLLRFPDVYSRLHALTKADNVGLGLVALALAVRSGSLRVTALVGIIWLLGMLAATVSSHLIARHELQRTGRSGEP